LIKKSLEACNIAIVDVQPIILLIVPFDYYPESHAVPKLSERGIELAVAVHLLSHLPCEDFALCILISMNIMEVVLSYFHIHCLYTEFYVFDVKDLTLGILKLFIDHLVYNKPLSRSAPALFRRLMSELILRLERRDSASNVLFNSALATCGIVILNSEAELLQVPVSPPHDLPNIGLL